MPGTTCSIAVDGSNADRHFPNVWCGTATYDLLAGGWLGYPYFEEANNHDSQGESTPVSVEPPSGCVSRGIHPYGLPPSTVWKPQ